MRKNLLKNLTVTFFIVLSLKNYAQDFIIKKNTEEIKCKVVEIEENKIKYKSFDNLNGPIYSISKDEVFMIKYENGQKETFNTTNTTKTENKTDDKTNKGVFDYKHILAIGMSSYHPILNAFENLGDGKGGGFCLMLRGSSFMNKKKTISLTSDFVLLKAKIVDYAYYDEYYNVRYANINYTGYGFIEKIDFHWLRTKTGSFYSGLGIGYIIGNISASNGKEYIDINNILGLAWQLDALGIQSRLAPNFGLFSELGYGYEGVFQFGVQFMW